MAAADLQEAEQFLSEGKYSLALNAGTRALKAAEEAGDAQATLASKKVVAKALLQTASEYVAAEQPVSAIEASSQATALMKDIGDKAGEADAMLALANAFVMAGDKESVDTARKAVKAYESLGDKSKKASALLTLAMGQVIRFDNAAAVKSAKESVKIYEDLGDAEGAENAKWQLSCIPGANFSDPKPIILASESMISQDALTAATVEHKKKNPTVIDNNLVKLPLPSPPQQMVLWGANLGTDGCPTQWSCEFAKYLCDMTSAQAIVPILVATKGVFGRQTGGMAAASLTDASGIALWGMVRSARQEMPKIPMILVDYPYGSTSAEISRCLQPADLEAIYYHDVKFTPKMEAVDSLMRRDVRRDGSGKPSGPKFQRKAFRWGGANHKLDNCWYRQSWVIAGAGRVGLGD